MAAGLLIAGAALVGVLLVATRGTQRRPEAPGQLIEVQEQPQITTTLAPPPTVLSESIPVSQPAPRFEILEAYLVDPDTGERSNTFPQDHRWPGIDVRVRVHVSEPTVLDVRVYLQAYPEGYLLGNESWPQEPSFDPEKSILITRNIILGTRPIVVAVTDSRGATITVPLTITIIELGGF